MNEHPISEIMDSSISNIKEMVDGNTVIGTPITTPDGAMIIPVTSIKLGFASGGSDFPTKMPKELFGGGAGAGLTVTPVAFLIVQNGNIRMIQLADQKSTMDRLVNMIPEVIDKVSALTETLASKKDEDKTVQADENL